MSLSFFRKKKVTKQKLSGGAIVCGWGCALAGTVAVDDSDAGI
jgi:hypothetical protein